MRKGFLARVVGAVVALVGLGLIGVVLADAGVIRYGSTATPVQVTIPPGSSFKEAVDTLESYGVLNRPRVFAAYARIKGADREIRAGEYSFPRPSSWARILRDLTEGRVLTESLTIPEGFTLKQMAPRIAAITGLEADSVLDRLLSPSAATELGVPGPTLEGYLFPDTYRFAMGVPLEEVLGAMAGRYREVWTPARVASREEMGMTEAEVVTLASIVQAEARLESEMPTIASVYHNRLDRGQLLQADPTVLYALGGRRARLLYAAMDSVAGHPYNTYTNPGLPPGPIGAPGMEALDAALSPADTDLYFFVAHPDGTHIFSRTLEEHNQAVAAMRREWDRLRRESQEGQGHEPQ
jgi:UPF0755 protein